MSQSNSSTPVSFAYEPLHQGRQNGLVALRSLSSISRRFFFLLLNWSVFCLRRFSIDGGALAAQIYIYRLDMWLVFYSQKHAINKILQFHMAKEQRQPIFSSKQSTCKSTSNLVTNRTLATCKFPNPQHLLISYLTFVFLP